MAAISGPYYEQQVRLYRDSLSTPWGFRLQGGKDFKAPLTIQRVFVGGPAEGDLHRGDIIVAIENRDASNLLHKQAQDIFKSCGGSLSMRIKRGTVIAPRSKTPPPAFPQSFRSRPSVGPSPGTFASPTSATASLHQRPGAGVGYPAPRQQFPPPQQPRQAPRPIIVSHVKSPKQAQDDMMMHKIQQSLNDVIWQPRTDEVDEPYESKPVQELKRQFAQPIQQSKPVAARILRKPQPAPLQPAPNPPRQPQVPHHQPQPSFQQQQSYDQMDYMQHQPAYQQQYSYEQPAYQQQQSYEQPAYRQQQSYEQPAYQQQQSYEQPVYDRQPSQEQPAYGRQTSVGYQGPTGGTIGKPVTEESAADEVYCTTPVSEIRKQFVPHLQRPVRRPPRQPPPQKPSWVKPRSDSPPTSLTEPGWCPKSFQKTWRPVPAGRHVQSQPRAAPRPAPQPAVQSGTPAWSGSLRSAASSKPWEESGAAPAAAHTPVKQAQFQPAAAAAAQVHTPRHQNVHYAPGQAPQYQQLQPQQQQQQQQQEPGEGGPRVVHLQYNSPIGLYSKDAAEEVLVGQTKAQSGQGSMHGGGPAKEFDPSKSSVLRLLQEEQRGQRQQYDPQQQQQQYGGYPGSPAQAYDPRFSQPDEDLGASEF